MCWDGAQNTPNPALATSGALPTPQQRVKPCRDPPTNQSCQPRAALDLCQPWKSHPWGLLLTALGLEHPGAATAKICHQQRVWDTPGAQEGETATGDSPRALFPLTAAVILGAWHNGECRGQLDPGKKGDVFFFKKNTTTLQLDWKKTRFCFSACYFFLSWRSSDSLQHFKVFPENEEQPQPCQEQFLSHQG